MSALDDLLSKTYGHPSSSTAVPPRAAGDGSNPSSSAALPADTMLAREAITLEVVPRDDCFVGPAPTPIVTASNLPSEEPLRTFTRHEPLADLPQQAVPDDTKRATTSPWEPTSMPAAEPTVETTPPGPHHTDADRNAARNAAQGEPPAEPAVPISQPQPGPETAASSFHAQWEVDDFLWPTICQELKKRIAAELQNAAGKLNAVYQQRGLGAVIVTSARSDAGRTSVTLGVAQELGGQGKSVALVDLDHEQPSLMERLGVVVDHGLECLDGQRYTAESICVRAVEENVTLAPLTTPISSAHCLYEEVQKLLSCLSRHHEVVLIDASADVAELLSRYAKRLQFGTLLVQDLRADDPQQQMQEIAGRVIGTNVHSVGVIENFAA